MSGPERWCEGCGELARTIDTLNAELARLRTLLPDRHWMEMILAMPAGYWFDDEGLRQWARSILGEHIRLDAGKEEGR